MERISEEAVVEFTLRYRGDLLATTGDNSRIREKQHIRRYLGHQLRELWRSDPRLKDMDPRALQTPRWIEGHTADVLRPIPALPNWSGFFFRHPLGGFQFVPLVSRPLEADCALAIRLHRPQTAGGIVFSGGDLDNRLKTLFDALRMPDVIAEIPDVAPGPGEDNLVFCLLQNDDLITRLTIESRRLLDTGVGENYVELDIDVTVRAVTPMSGNLPLVFP